MSKPFIFFIGAAFLAALGFRMAPFMLKSNLPEEVLIKETNRTTGMTGDTSKAAISSTHTLTVSGPTLVIPPTSKIADNDGSIKPNGTRRPQNSTQSVTTRSDVDGKSHSSPRPDREEVGREIPMSALVRRSCEVSPVGVCKILHDHLTQMAAEPRDPQWATDLEDELDRFLPAKGLFVRYVECRTSFCAFEVSGGESIQEIPILNDNPPWPADAYYRLDFASETAGYEHDVNGALIKLHFVVLRRH